MKAFCIFRIRQRWLHGQADPDAEKPVPGAPEDGRAEEERGHEHGKRQHGRRPWAAGPSRLAQANGKKKRGIFEIEMNFG